MPKLEKKLISVQKGLSVAEVEYRYQQNLVNYDTSVATKTVKEIVIDNILTLFNIS